VPNEYGFWVDLGSVELEESSNGTWIQAFTEGTYNHPLFGEMKFDAGRLKRFADSVNNRTRGVQPDIDYEHKMFSGEAAGWVKSAEYRNGKGLHIQVEWTPKARAAIANKEYRYFSPTFADEWEDPKSQKVHKDVMFGGALTNRPFLKDLLPVNLSEIFAEEVPAPKPDPQPGGLMDPKELRRILGLAEDATDEQVNQRVAQLKQLQEVLNKPPTPPAPPTPPEPPKPADPPTTKSVEQLLAELGQVDKEHPAVKMLTSILDQQRTTIEAQAKQLHEAEVERMLEELDRGKKFAVPPAVKEQLRAILLQSNKELGEAVYETYKKTMELGVIDLNEYGWQRKGEAVSATDALNAEIRKLMEADKELRYSDAYKIVAGQRPDLVQAARQDSYIKDGV
jgi:hypothetical protein